MSGYLQNFLKLHHQGPSSPIQQISLPLLDLRVLHAFYTCMECSCLPMQTGWPGKCEEQFDDGECKLSKPSVLHIFFHNTSSSNTWFQAGDEKKSPQWRLFFFHDILSIPHLPVLQEFASPFRKHGMERNPQNLMKKDLRRNGNEEKPPVQNDQCMPGVKYSMRLPVQKKNQLCLVQPMKVL